jgi:hypothetical protein
MPSFDRLIYRPGRAWTGGGPSRLLSDRSRREPAAHEGQPLDPATQGLMERRFGGDLARIPTHAGGRDAEAEANRIAHAVAYPAARPAAAGSFDFSETRIHTSPEAAASATALGAMAYTSGRDIVFAPGRYRPDMPPGRELLAHELVHTIQQRRAPDPAGAAVQRQDAQPPTSMSDTVLSVFPYAKGSQVALTTLFPDSLFGFGPNHISSWVHGLQDQQVTVSEATAEVFRATAGAPVRPRGVAEGGTGGAAVPDVSIQVERTGAGRFQIQILSGAKILAAQEVRATRGQLGATVLAPVAAAPRPPPSAGQPLSPAAPLPGLEEPSRPDRDKAALDALAAPPTPPVDTTAADQKKITDALGKVAEAFVETPEGKRLLDPDSAKKLPPEVLVALPITLVSAAFAGFAGLVATKTESPVTTSPDIPLPDIGGVKIKGKVTYKGPANRPTEASITLTFAKGSLEVAPAFKATWRDPAQPPSPDNASGITAGLFVKIPLGPDAQSDKKEPSDTEKMRAEVAEPARPEARTGLRYKPGPPEVLQSFDMKSGPGKRPWNLDRLSKQIGAAFAASRDGTLHVIAIFDGIAGDTEEARKTNGERQDAAAANADVVKRALEQWLPFTKGRIETRIHFKGSEPMFGLSAEADAELGARDVSVIFVSGASR